MRIRCSLSLLSALALAFVLLAACSDEDGSEAPQSTVCAPHELADQCPLGTSASLNPDWIETCDAGADTIRVESSVTAVCIGEADCHLPCLLAEPCLCGVASVGATVECHSPCVGTMCGNGVCDEFETPRVCAEDCAPAVDPVCDSGQRQCTADGGLEVCSPAGQWDTVPCPSAQVCSGGECIPCDPGTAGCPNVLPVVRTVVWTFITACDTADIESTSTVRIETTLEDPDTAADRLAVSVSVQAASAMPVTAEGASVDIETYWSRGLGTPVEISVQDLNAPPPGTIRERFLITPCEDGRIDH